MPIKSSLILLSTTFLLAGCASTMYFEGLEDEVALIEEQLVPIRNVDGPLYRWGAGETGYERADVPPEPEGGIESLMTSARYPQGARERCAEGDVMVRFVVDEEGEVIAAEPVEAVDPDLEVAAIATVARTRFTPAVKNDEPVKVVMRIPFSFNLPGQSCAARNARSVDGDVRYR